MRRFYSRGWPTLLSLACVGLVGCPAPPNTQDSNTTDIQVIDGGMDGTTTDDADANVDDVQVTDTTDAGEPDTHGGLLLPRCEDTEPGDPMLTPVASTLLGTIEPMAARLSSPGTLNPITEAGELMYRAQNLHLYGRGGGQSRVRRTELGDGTTLPMNDQRRSIAYFVHLSDTQLVDDESPVRLAGVDNPATSGGARAQEAYLPRAQSAMNRTLAALQRTERPFQFGVFAGDCTDSALLNELRWFIQLMNGQPNLHTDSGNDDDPVPGPDNDPKDPFDPVAFPAPWYFAPGNHDVEVVGIGVVTDQARQQALGTFASQGTRIYSQWYAPARRTTIPADAQRALIGPADIVRELQTGPALPGPVGHGYRPDTDVRYGAHSAVDVIPGLLRLLILDSNDYTGGSEGVVLQETVDTFLRPQLDLATRDGVLVAIASHHPLSSIDRLQGQGVGTPVIIPNAVEPAQVDALLFQYPNMIMWLVGHQHDVKILPHRGPDTAHPGYWEIQSGSMADWPAQSRIVELVDNGNGTLSIFGTMVDFDPENCMERRFRRLTLMEYLSRWDADHTGTAQDRNVELVLPIPMVASSAINAASTSAGMSRGSRLESTTTLQGMR